MRLAVPQFWRKHQICALFSFKRGDSKEAEYTCPKCYVWEREHGLRMPLPQSVVLGAKDLPTTMLSDHIEEQLFKRLREERHERSIHDVKSFDEESDDCGSKLASDGGEHRAGREHEWDWALL